MGEMDIDVQGGKSSTRAMLEIMEYRLFVNMRVLDGWVNEVVEQFPIEDC